VVVMTMAPSSSRPVLRHGGAAALALGLVACGGKDAGRPSAEIVVAAAPDFCALSQNYEYQKIVDFEPQGQSRWATCDPAVSCQSDAKPTAFYFNFDAAHTAPLPDGVTGKCVTNTPCSASITQRDVEDSQIPDGPRCGTSANALHLTVSNVGLCFGDNGRLGWGAALDLNFSPSFDASAWDGVALWVRRGSAASGEAFVLSVIDQQNDAIGGDFMSDHAPGCGCQQSDPTNNPRAWTCFKDPGSDFPDSKKCDAFGAAVSLTDDWSFVTIPFDRIKQKGFGAVSGPFDPSLLKRLQFLLNFGSWDFWLDDLSFYRQPR
jgi:hypothetical protein